MIAGAGDDRQECERRYAPELLLIQIVQLNELRAGRTNDDAVLICFAFPHPSRHIESHGGYRSSWKESVIDLFSVDVQERYVKPLRADAGESFDHSQGLLDMVIARAHAGTDA